MSRSADCGPATARTCDRPLASPAASVRCSQRWREGAPSIAMPRSVFDPIVLYTAADARTTWEGDKRAVGTTPIKFLVHDRDRRFGATFDEVFKAEGSGSSARPGGHHERMPMPSDASGLSGPNVSTDSSSSTNATYGRYSRPMSTITTDRDHTEGVICRLPRATENRPPLPDVRKCWTKESARRIDPRVLSGRRVTNRLSPDSAVVGLSDSRSSQSGSQTSRIRSDGRV